MITRGTVFELALPFSGLSEFGGGVPGDEEQSSHRVHVTQSYKQTRNVTNNTEHRLRVVVISLYYYSIEEVLDISQEVR